MERKLNRARRLKRADWLLACELTESIVEINAPGALPAPEGCILPIVRQPVGEPVLKILGRSIVLDVKIPGPTKSMTLQTAGIYGDFEMRYHSHRHHRRA